MDGGAKSSHPGASTPPHNDEMVRLTVELRSGSAPPHGAVCWEGGYREFQGLLELLGLVQELSVGGRVDPAAEAEIPKEEEHRC